MPRISVIGALLVALLAIAAFVLYSSSDYECHIYKLPSLPPLVGPISVNDHLTKAKILLQDQIFGPESLVVEGDVIYTGTETGSVVQIKNGQIQKTMRLEVPSGQECDGSYDSEPICGRPLGIRRLDNASMIIADAYRGIYSMNFEQGTHKIYLDGNASVDGIPLMFIDDLDVVNEDWIVFTDASSRWQRRDFMKPILEGIPNGRVLSLQLSTGKLSVLLDNLYFANGIQLFKDKQSFLVTETGAARIKRHWISGPKKGTTEVFAYNLPGFPDNIRMGEDDTFWVALAAIRYQGKFSAIDFFGDKPILRKLILQFVPDWCSASVAAKHTMIIQLNAAGQIIRSAHDPTGQLNAHFSQVTDAGQFLYLGSFNAKFIGQLHKSELKL